MYVDSPNLISKMQSCSLIFRTYPRTSYPQKWSASQNLLSSRWVREVVNRHAGEDVRLKRAFTSTTDSVAQMALMQSITENEASLREEQMVLPMPPQPRSF